MDAPAPDDTQLSGNGAVLLEILGVLKSIDGRLYSHERRIDELSSKIAQQADTIQSSKAVAQVETRPHAQTTFVRAERRGIHTKPFLRNRSVGLDAVRKFESLDSSSSGSSFSHNKPPITIDTGDQRPPLRTSQRRESSSGIEKRWSSTSHSPTAARNLIPRVSTLSRADTFNSLSEPPRAETPEDEYGTEIQDPSHYSKYPPPQRWIVTRSQGRELEVKQSAEKLREKWTSYVGDSWTIPPDGRIEMTFQQHILERLDSTQATSLLETLRDVSSKLEYHDPNDLTKRGSFRVTDYEFDTNFKESIAEYRADVLTGQYKRHPVKSGGKKQAFDWAGSAPWKRIIEIRGLSKNLIDDHETWTRNFRDPWNEALPKVNPICPLLTDREGDDSYGNHTRMINIQHALLHHQLCWRRPPPCQNDISFHVTFYEIIQLEHKNELQDEIWESGRLHSEHTFKGTQFGSGACRIRESACTILAVADDVSPQYWTLLYLCPNNFELYDKSQNFERYDTITNAIKLQDAAGVAEVMVDFTCRMVIERWEVVVEFFAALIGHRDSLSDPDAHDSLLFDDDSFSRSRRYFWAINYLAELSSSITGNIVQFDKFAAKNKSISGKLDQLYYLRGRLHAQREEAIALRDGLFSASGVIESRASTRLGENIKLLTFVSIFFLPLSFCMSLWSINSTVFSLHALIIVVVLVGLGTYLIVFNLNNIVGVCSRIYAKHKLKLIEQMKKDPAQEWRERGNGFAMFTPKQTNMKPSEWTMVVFILRNMFHSLSIGCALGRRRKLPLQVDKKDDKQGENDNWPNFAELPATPAVAKTTESEPVDIKRWSSLGSGLISLGKIFRRGAFSPTVPGDV